MNNTSSEQQNQTLGNAVLLLEAFKTYSLTYLCAREGFHFPVLNTGGSFANIHRVVEEGLVFGRELLRPVPDWREIHDLVFPLRDRFILGKVLQRK